MKDFRKSLQDDSIAISLEPDNGIRYWFRGMTYVEMSFTEKALQDFDKGIELNPNKCVFLASKGLVYRRKGLFDEAIKYYKKAFNVAKSIEKKKSYLYYSAICYYFLNDFEKAKEKLTEILKYKEKDGYNDYARLWLKLIDIRKNKKIAIGHTFVKDHLKAIEELFAGKKTVSECINAALTEDSKTERGQLCEAYFFVAEYYLLVKKDKKKAEKYFWKCIDTGKKDFVEYNCAKAELKRLYKKQK